MNSIALLVLSGRLRKEIPDTEATTDDPSAESDGLPPLPTASTRHSPATPQPPPLE
jgi:hypothetical protein